MYNATKNGIKNCPNCKAIDEAILEESFMEAFGLLAGNFDDVLEIVLQAVEESLNNDEDVRRKKQLDKDISVLESKKSRMTDMLIDGTITKEVYDEKLIDYTRKIHTLDERRKLLEDSINRQKNVGKRMADLRATRMLTSHIRCLIEKCVHVGLTGQIICIHPRVQTHVETVCLLSKLHEAKHHLDVTLEMDELDVTSAESKATYEEIKEYVLKEHGLQVSNLYIAQVKRKCGIIERENYNVRKVTRRMDCLQNDSTTAANPEKRVSQGMPKNEDAKQPQCPEQKEKVIRCCFAN